MSADREGAVSRVIREPEDPGGSERELGSIAILGARTPDPNMTCPEHGLRTAGFRIPRGPNPAVAAGLALLLLAPLCGAQPWIAAPGFGTSAFHRDPSSPFAIGAITSTGDGRVFAAMRHELRELDGNGGAHPRFALSSGDAFGFLLHDARSRRVFASSFLLDTLYTCELRTQTWSASRIPKNAFDGALLHDGRLLVSANPLWPSTNANTGVWLVDPSGASHREIVKLSGPSGPLALAGNGDLYVALLPTTVPPPSGSVAILRFDAARVQGALRGGPALVSGDASVRLAGLDGAYDLVFDDHGCLLFSDPNRGVVQRTRPGALLLDPTPLSSGSGGITNLAFVPGTRARFAAYQPEDAGHLLALTSDWSASCEVRRVAPARAWLTTSPGVLAPPGPVAVHVFDAAPNATLGIAVTFVPPGTEELHGWLAGSPLWWSLANSSLHAWIVTSTASDGHARLDLQHPGGFTAPVWFQAAFLGAGVFPAAGSTAVNTLTLQR